jgi:hypothetical protein
LTLAIHENIMYSYRQEIVFSEGSEIWEREKDGLLFNRKGLFEKRVSIGDPTNGFKQKGKI